MLQNKKTSLMPKLINEALVTPTPVEHVNMQQHWTVMLELDHNEMNIFSM